MLDATQSAQGLNSNAHTKNSPPNIIIFHKGIGSHKEWMERAQEAVEILYKWLETSNPQEKGEGGVPFIGIWKN
jgi:hypothetical protein